MLWSEQAVRKIEAMEQKAQQLSTEVRDLKHIVNELRMEKVELREERMVLREKLRSFEGSKPLGQEQMAMGSEVHSQAAHSLRSNIHTQQQQQRLGN